MIYLFFIFLTTNLLTYYRQTNYLYLDNKVKPLHDIIHSNKFIHDITIKKEFCDIFPPLCFCLVNNYSKYIECYSNLILIRFICFNSTILPPPMKLKKVRLSFGLIPNYTYDFIYSGHTMTCVLSIFFTDFKIICCILSLLCSLSVIITKEHYTIDVIVAWIATYSAVSFNTIGIKKLLI